MSYSLASLRLKTQKSGLNSCPVDDNFYSSKMMIEALFDWPKSDLKLNFKEYKFFQIY